MIDLVAVVVFATAAWLGWRRGTVLMAIAASGLVLSSLVAFVLYRPLGAVIARVFGAPAPIALGLGGLVAMLAATIAQKVAVRRIERARARRRAEGWRPTTADSAGGAAFGGVWVGTIGLLLVWCVMSLASLTGSASSVERSVTGRAASAIAERVTYVVVKHTVGDPFIATFIARLGARPGAASAAVRTVLGDHRLQRIWTDPALRQALTGRDLQALERDPDIQALAADEHFRRAAQQVGLVGTQPGPDALAQDLIVNVGPLVRAVESLQQDPAAQRLLKDPGLVDALKDGNTTALALNPALSGLGSRLAEILKANAAAGR